MKAHQTQFFIKLFLFLFLILSCSHKKEIPVFKPKPILSLGKLDDPHESFHKPADVAADSKGNIYVLDSGNHRVVKFDKDGRYLLEFGRFGQGPGEFSSPVDIYIDRRDKIYIIDSGNRRMQIFNDEGKRVTEFRIRIFFGSLARCAVDSKGKIYVNYP